MPRARFGSLDVRFGAAPQYCDLLPFHFRVWPTADDATAPDVELTIVDAPEPRPRVEGLDDLLALQCSAHGERITSSITELLVEPGATPIRARLTVWSAAQDPAFVVHYVVVNLRTLLRRLGRIQLHGAAATIGGRTVVLLGAKGAGKSTLSLAIGRAGGTVLADDQLVLSVAAGSTVTISGVDGGLRLTEQTERHFFATPLDHEPQDFAGTLKKEVPLGAYVGAAPGIDARPTDCYFPRVDDAFAIVPLDRTVALRRILDSLVPLHRFAGAPDQMDFVRAVTAFVRTVDTYDLVLSPDLRELDRVVAALAGGAA